MRETQHVYGFDGERQDSPPDPKTILGSKGTRLAKMASLGLPIPAGFTLSIETCQQIHEEHDQLHPDISDAAQNAMRRLEESTGCRWGDSSKPLLVSIRTSAHETMPGMVSSVLNVGINDTTVEGLSREYGCEKFALDCYRRALQQYGNLVLGMREDVLEQFVERIKYQAGVVDDHELDVAHLKALVTHLKTKIIESTGQYFPQDPDQHLWDVIRAVIGSWNNRRALDYRNAHNIAHNIATAVTVQVMAFGNHGTNSGIGGAVTRDPKTGEPRFFGEWLPEAQGEDVVSGLRTPQPINPDSGTLEEDITLEEAMPAVYNQLVAHYKTLEEHFGDMQDLKFAIERGTLWVLESRPAKRSAGAAIRIAVDLAREGLISKSEAVKRISTETLERVLHPQVDPNAERTIIARGLGASPGAATGRVVFFADDAIEWSGRGEAVILVREETSPEDIHGMLKARGILTSRGGMTSHAAVVARGMSKTCISGCSALHINPKAREFTAGERRVVEGDVITIDGTDGSVMLGAIDTIQPSPSEELSELMNWVDEFRSLHVYANADTPRDCMTARRFGAQGVGLCRTEHMFFEEGRIQAVREMILADDEQGRRHALAKILPMQKSDFKEIFRVMAGLPVTIRLLDPPLHEFLPYDEREIRALAQEMNIAYERLDARNRALREINPILGHRGCRLGLSYPEIYEMQVRAIIEAVCETAKDGESVTPGIMVPLVGHVREFELLKDVIETTANRVLSEQGNMDIHVQIGTMVELPRTCLRAGKIAEHADFFSFGTNDLTQTTFGISRDDCGRFLPLYVEVGILPNDPFVSLDPAVAELVEIAVTKGRDTKPSLEIGLCGEQGGEPSSIKFCHTLGLDYVSCSPFRVPVARLAAAHAALQEKA